MRQEDYNDMMKSHWEKPANTKSDLPACPHCNERYLGDGLALCVDCAHKANKENMK